MKKRTVLGLIVIMMAVCFQASALEVTASVVPTLKDVQYYEFGFSAGPVTDGNPQFISGGKLEFVPDIKINNGVVAVACDWRGALCVFWSQFEKQEAYFQ